MRGLLAPLACLIALASGSTPAFAAPSLPSLFVVESATPGATFTTPTAIAFLPGGRMLVAEKAGIVYSVTNGVKRTTPLWTRTNEVLNEHDRGLLGLAVDPNYVTNHYIYLLYTVDPDSNGVDPAPSDAFCRLVRYRISFTDSNTVDYTTRTILMGVSQRYGPLSASPSHTIGALRFGRDGSLLLTSGDGASYTQTDAGGLDGGDFGSGANKTDPYEDIGAFRAQSLSSLCGKVLRLNPANGAGYASNPYWDGNPYSVRSRVWAYGIRNPFRFCIRPGTGVADTAQGNPGTVVIGDVGYNTWEEMNIVRIPGANFGWPCYEGLGPQTNYQAATPAHNGCGSIGTADNPASVTAPTATWHHSNAALGSPAGFSGNCSVGGVFYTGDRYPAQYRGSYFFADYGQSWLKVATLDGNSQLVSIAGFGSAMDGPVDFTTDPSTGDIYYVAITTGEVRRLRYTGVVSNLPPVAVADGAPAFGVAPLSVTFSSTGSSDPDSDPLTLSWLFGDGTGSSAASPSHVYASAGSYDCVLTADDGRGGIGRDTVRIIVSATSAFPTTGILDNFNRANGPVGGSWVGQTAGLVIDANALALTGGDVWPVWNGGVFGPDQEAYVTFSQTSATAAEQNLMLKVQGTNYTTGHVEVWYSATASRVTVSSYLPATGWKVEGTVAGILFAPGDQLGARALSNGIVQVFRNGVLRGSVSVASWPFAASASSPCFTISGACLRRSCTGNCWSMVGLPRRATRCLRGWTA